MSCNVDTKYFKLCSLYNLTDVTLIDTTVNVMKKNGTCKYMKLKGC